MSGTLGSLVLKLSADVGTISADLGKVASAHQQYASKATQVWQDAADSIGNSISNMAGKIVAAFSLDKLVEAGQTAIDTADKFDKMSQRVGLSVEALSSLSVQAKLSGSDIDSVASGLDTFSRNVALAAAGSQKQALAFSAIGVSVKDANGNIRSQQDILQDVATKFSTYAAGITKTADAQAFFGRGADALIPTLNNLGAKGFAGATAQAQQFGAVISGETAKQADQFNTNIASLRLESEGFANAVVKDLLPGLNQLTSKMVEANKTTDDYAGSSSVVANAIKGIIASVITAKELISGLATSTFAFFDAVKTVFGSAGDVISAWGTAVAAEVKAAFTFDGSGLAQADAVLKAKLATITATFNTSMAGIKSGLSGGVGDAITNAQNAWTSLFGAIDKTAASAKNVGDKLGTATAPLIPNAAAANAAANAQTKLNDAFAKDAEEIANAGAKLNPVAKVYQDYVKSIEQAVVAYDNEIDLINKFHLGTTAAAQALQNLTDKRNADYAALQAQIAAQVKQNDVVGIYLDKLSADTAMAGLTDRQQAQQKAIDELTISWNKLTVAQQQQEVAAGKIDPTTIAGTAAIKDQVGALYDQAAAAKAASEAAKQWQSIWITAGNGIADTFAKVLVEGGSLFDGLKSLAQQTVEAIISYFAKLAVINPILDAVFGQQAGFSPLATLGSLSGSSGGVSSLFGGGASADSSSTGGIFSAASWATAGKNLFSGFQSLWSGSPGASGSSILGGSNYFTDANGFMQGTPYTPSLFGNVVGIGGGILAGYNEYQNAGGGIGGLAGGAAYGLGTLTATGAIGGVLSGVGASAGAAGALGSVGLGAIPVVGWIALAAMAVDYISGGKLFGTKGKLDSTHQTLDVGSAGIDLAESYTLKGQKALFGGSKYTTHDITPDSAAEAAAQSFFDSIQKNTDQFAKQFNTTVGGLVGGTFTQDFDKNGNPTTSTTTINGQTYTGETQAQFGQRLVDENDLAILDTFDSKLSTMLDGFRGDVDTLTQVTTGLASAQLAFQGGEKFLALGSDQSLSAMLALAESMQGAGETIDQTFARIEQAQQQYDQFVGQFKPATTYVDDFEGGLSQIYKQLLASQAQANAYAKAAGAAGASTEDLTNITTYYANQAAALTLQLENSAQSLAFSLGITNQGSLDQVTQEINQLESQASGGSAAVQNFGSAIHDTAQKATDAMNLLLGNLSPLNDQQKLQAALSGLRAGTVTADQVLTIGRQLYASSEAYTQLFNEVQQYGGKSTGAAAHGGGGGSSGGGLSAADQEKLQTLLGEQKTLQAAQTLTQYQTLAQQIAEIASAKQESWQDVLKEMDIKSSDLEKGLGLANDDALNTYISNIQKQTDSAGDNTTSIVNAIIALPQQIADAINGTYVPPSSTNPNTAVIVANPTTPIVRGPIAGPVPATPPGTGSNGTAVPVTPPADVPGRGILPAGRTMTDADVAALGASVGMNVVRGMQPTVNGLVNLPSRNLRTPAVVR